MASPLEDLQGALDVRVLELHTELLELGPDLHKCRTDCLGVRLENVAPHRLGSPSDTSRGSEARTCCLLGVFVLRKDRKRARDDLRHVARDCNGTVVLVHLEFDDSRAKLTHEARYCLRRLPRTPVGAEDPLPIDEKIRACVLEAALGMSCHGMSGDESFASRVRSNAGDESGLGRPAVRHEAARSIEYGRQQFRDDPNGHTEHRERRGFEFAAERPLVGRIHPGVERRKVGRRLSDVHRDESLNQTVLSCRVGYRAADQSGAEDGELLKAHDAVVPCATPGYLAASFYGEAAACGLCSRLRRVNEQPQENDRFIGKLLSDRYRIKRKIGEGGMGIVYEAIHEAIEKRIALKVLHARYSASPDVVSRFKQEAISASRIKHQNVIDVFDFGQLGDGSCFIAMEYLEGVDLGAALERRRHFAPDESIRIAVQMCRALGLGHGRGVVHRDLKPENVFLQMTPEGEEIVKIVDFGIAQLRANEDAAEQEEHERRKRLTKTGMIFGTPEYMAPEQARGAKIDHRSDVYSTGVILYELLTGTVPFVGESFLEVLNQHVQNAVPPFTAANPDLDVSPELQHAVLKALEKDPEDRYPSMKDFATALVRTPEGRRARTRISSISDDDDDEASQHRIENSRYPKPPQGAETAMFGSAGEASAKMPSDDEPVQLPQSSSKLGLSILLFAAAGAAIVGYFVFGSRAAPEESAPTSPAVETAEPSTPIEPEDAPSSVEDGAESDEPPGEEPATTRVTLDVSTVPEGAILQKDGFQVCDSTPCELLVEPGEAVTLTAEKGSARGEAKVLAQKDQEVTIRLKTAQVARPAPRPASGPTLCEVMVDGIKILRPCE